MESKSGHSEAAFRQGASAGFYTPTRRVTAIGQSNGAVSLESRPGWFRMFGRTYALRTLLAWSLPFWPVVTSNATVWPSSRDL